MGKKYEGRTLGREPFAFARGWAVVVAEKDQGYGGPEEGGWYYTTHDVVYVEHGKTMSEATAHRRADELLRGRFKREGRPYYSVNYRGGEYSAWVVAPGEVQEMHTPRSRPYYS